MMKNHACFGKMICISKTGWIKTPLNPNPSIPHLPFKFNPTCSLSLGFQRLNLSCIPQSILSNPCPIDHDLLDSVEISEDGFFKTAHNNSHEALDAVDNGVSVADLSHFGRICVCGDDRINFLHNQTTANFECLGKGQGCDTVFVTETARTIDIAHAWIMKNAITLMVSEETRSSIINILTKYIFLSDKVEIHDITNQTRFFVLAGPKSNQVMKDLNLGDLVGQPYGTHCHYSVNGMPITVGVGNIISKDGFSMLMPLAAAGFVWKTLLSKGAVPMDSNAWEILRIFRGRPTPGKELTAEFNVLECGLWNSVSLNKGCYKGQETISRLIAYDGVKQKLWGICLSGPAEVDSYITVDGKKVGKLTSYAVGRGDSEYFGLGYVKTKAASKGDKVTVGNNSVGQLVEVPFLAHQSPSSTSP